MILALDAGNTNIVVGCVDEKTGKSVFERRIHTDGEKTSTEYAVSIKTIMDLQGINAQQISGGILSSSVPHVTRQLKNAAEIILDKPILEVGGGIKIGNSVNIPDPGLLGPDLVVGAVAGCEEYGTPLIIVDMGTATTISVINKDKDFMGGMILPGVKVALNGLINHAAHLPQIAIELPETLINGSTVGAMQSGSIYGHASCIDGMVERIWDDLGYETTVVATGGFAQVVIPCCKKNIIVDSDLLIKGLLRLYEMNK